jgi:LuxR family maltose regulon positive regulatory protein
MDGLSHVRQKVAWVSLDENDNDPVRFMLYFITALQSILPQVGQATLSLLSNPELPSSARVISELLNELDEVGEPVIVVLDDYHLIQQPYIHQAVEFLLEHPPAALHLVMTTREDPPFPLARWRVKGRLQEFRTADLRFTPAEVEEFFQKNLEISLDKTALTVLAERTEGWIAGLQLAGLSMKQLVVEGASAINRFINDFRGSHRFVFDYLLSDVLRRYPAEIRDFLRQTSILDRFSIALCTAVTGHRDSGRLLAAIEGANLFLIPLDDRREWFRYHHLFADFLRAELSKEEETALYQSAAHWCEAEGLFSEAIQYYLSAADYEGAARLLCLTAEELALKYQIRAWLKWAVKLPPVQLEKNPELAVQMAWAYFFTGDPKQAMEIISGLAKKQGSGSELNLSSKVQGKLLGIRATLAGLRGSPETPVLARKALALIPEDAQLDRALASITLGMSNWQNGAAGEAIQLFRQAYAWGKKLQHPLLAVASLLNLAFALNIQGRSRQARQLCTEAFTLFTDRTGKPLPVVDLLYIPLSLLHYQANQVDTACEYAKRGNMMAREVLSQAIMGGNAEYVLVKAYFALGRTDQALAEVAQARELAKSVGYTTIIGGLDAIEAELALKIGRLDQVRSWAAGVASRINDLSLHRNWWTLCTYVRFLLAEERTEEALQHLATMEHTARESGCDGRPGSTGFRP